MQQLTSPVGGEPAANTPEEDQRIDSILVFFDIVSRGRPLVELRALQSYRAMSGFFDDYRLAAANVVAASDEANVYFGLNPIDTTSSILLGRLNEIVPGKAAADEHIASRQLLLVDIDPTRPPNCCSTKGEKQAAADVALKVVKHLRTCGWPDPIVIDSGNGIHLLFAVDLPAADAGLVHRVLRALDFQFSIAEAKIDTTVANPARICRVPYTANRKGEPTSDRPHRTSNVLKYPAAFIPVPLECLERIALPTERGEPASTVRAKQDKERPYTSSTKLLEQARAKLHTLPIAVQGQNGSKACFRAACLLAIDFGLSIETSLPLLREWSDRCHPAWTDEELVHKLKDAVKKAKANPDKVGSLAAPKKTKRKTVVEQLLELAENRCRFWHDREDKEPFATIEMPNTPSHGQTSNRRRWHQRHLPVKSTEFADAIRAIYYGAIKRTPTGPQMRTFLDTVGAKARIDGNAESTYLRVARRKKRVYLDLGGPNWRTVRITARGWKIMRRTTPKLRRTGRTQPLPHPKSGGSILLLQQLLNLDNLGDLQLLVGWLVTVLGGRGPFPILVLSGEQGSAKSTATEFIRGLVDPIKAGLGSIPKEERDLMIAAQNSFVVSFDNVSYIDANQSDSLCRLATGAGYGTRKLYTDGEEFLIQVCRAIMLNGIGEYLYQADALDRSVIVSLPVIDEASRRTAEEVQSEYRRARPYLLGLLLDGVAMALKNYNRVKPNASHRMADFERWAAASMPAFGWTEQEFFDSYANNIRRANAVAIGDNPVVDAIEALLAHYGGNWPKAGQVVGSKGLLAELEYYAGDPNIKSKPNWPKTPPVLSRTIRRLAPALRRYGIAVTIDDRDGGGKRLTPVTIEDLRATPPTSAAVPSPEDV